MTDEPHLPVGRFSTWLQQTLEAHTDDSDVDVPCGDCVACCTSSYFVHIRPDDVAALSRVPAELLVPAPGAPKGHVVMGYDQRGKCPMLEEGRCSIYEDRPLTCRAYDCRVFAAAGIEADRPAITARARTWVFEYPTEEDRRAHDAVRAAAAFLRRHPACFTGGAQADNPAHVALLAVKVAGVFRDRDAGQGTGGKGRHEGTVGAGRHEGTGGARRQEGATGARDDELVKAVLAANETFEAGRSR